MSARALLFTAALTLTACGPTTAPPPNAPPAAAANDALLSATPAAGQWSFLGDEGTISAAFGAPDSAPQLLIVCNSPVSEVRLIVNRALTPDQPATLTLITETHRIAMAGQSFTQDPPRVEATVADVARKANLIEALAANQQRFAVEIAGETTIYPWDEAIPRALDDCR